MNMKLRKGSPLAGWKAFVEACPTCKNQRSNLCKKCKMEVESGYDPKPEFAMTNADRIRAMSDEELAEFLVEWENASVCTAECYAHCKHECNKCIEKWLKQPAEGE
jgi:hypothetical protein